MPKFEALLHDLERAIERLEEGCQRLKTQTESDSLLRDGLIQRFEFCFELGWKSIQAAAAVEGVIVRSPKGALGHALASSWIDEESLWFRMLEARNLSSHTYNERIAAELVSEIPTFLTPLRLLLGSLQTH